MELRELIGKRIIDIMGNEKPEIGGLDTFDCYLVLEDNLTIAIPWALDEDVWVRTEMESGPYISCFNDKVAEKLSGAKILDVIACVGQDKAFIEMDNGLIVTEVTAAMHGTGRAGLWLYKSIADFEKEFGKDYLRLSNQ